MKTRLCGDVIRQTAVGPQTPPSPPLRVTPLHLSLLLETNKERDAYGERRGSPVLTEQENPLDKPGRDYASGIT